MEDERGNTPLGAPGKKGRGKEGKGGMTENERTCLWEKGEERRVRKVSQRTKRPAPGKG